jgi:hypothetical protein
MPVKKKFQSKTIDRFTILPQPDETTCGPTCLHSVYSYYRDILPLEQVIEEVPSLENGGGTLAMYLGTHALRRGYQATIYTYNLNVFDPTWFDLPAEALRAKLKAQLSHKKQAKLRLATHTYMEFLDNGGQIKFRDLTSSLIRHYLNRNIPILTGLSATYLYQSAREYGINCDYDDIRGEPSGHFVMLYGYDRKKFTVRVADPLTPNPNAPGNKYEVSMPRLICSILLGVLTYDAKLLIIEPPQGKNKPRL